MPNLDYNDPAWLAQLASVGETWGGPGGVVAGNTAGGGGGTPPFDLNAPSRKGQGPFGNVPGAIGLPPVYNDVAGVFPNLSGNLSKLGGNISSELSGELGPETMAMLQNTAAQFGIGAGVPLSPFSGAQGLRHLGLTAEGQRAKGIEHLLGALPTVAKTLTISPETQLDVANRNSVLNAAPDPEAAAREAERLFNAYMKKLGGGGGMSFGGGGGGAPRNVNAPGGFTPWAGFGGDVAATGSRPGTTPYAGSGINWGTQGPAPQDLWGGGGPTNTTDYWNDWFNWDNTQGSPDAGYLGEWGAGGPTPPQYPDFPEWDT
jgi:hypothetical protein